MMDKKDWEFRKKVATIVKKYPFWNLTPFKRSVLLDCCQDKK